MLFIAVPYRVHVCSSSYAHVVVDRSVLFFRQPNTVVSDKEARQRTVVVAADVVFGLEFVKRNLFPAAGGLILRVARIDLVRGNLAHVMEQCHLSRE